MKTLATFVVVLAAAANVIGRDVRTWEPATRSEKAQQDVPLIPPRSEKYPPDVESNSIQEEA